VEGAVTSAGVLEPNVSIRQRVVRNPNSRSVVTSPDSAYGTEATLRNSRRYEPDETLVKPTELSFETCRDITPDHCLSAFETFWAQFQNCSVYNRWTTTEQLAYLRASLQKVRYTDKYRIEVRNGRRKTGEPLQSLHSDIRRLVALVFPELDYRARETIACDYFIDALADPDFALNVRERSPANLNSALPIALQLEVWTKDADRIRNEQPKHFERIAREITRTESLVMTVEELRKQVSELQDQLARVTLRSNASNSVGRPAAERHVAEGSRSNMKPRPKDFVCWGCGSPDHPIRLCPNKTPEERRQRFVASSGKANSELHRKSVHETPKRKSTQHRRRLEPKT